MIYLYLYLYYRLVQDNLEKDIEPSLCRYIVKKDKVVIKLHKVKGTSEFSPYDRWNNLLSRKSREQKQADKAKANDPGTQLQSMLKDMYGDTYAVNYTYVFLCIYVGFLVYVCCIGMMKGTIR